MNWLVKIGLVLGLLLVAWRAFRVFQSGSIRVFDTDGPIPVIGRRDRPFAFWSFVMLFYALLLAIAALAAGL